MLYHYLAADKENRIVEGNYDAENLQGVLQYIAGRELRPISVKSVRETAGPTRGFWGRITNVDKVFLTKYLSLMLRVGTDLLSAINILIADFDKASVKNLLLEVRDNLTRGKPFYEVFERYPRVFTAVFVNLVKAAEASGNLQQTFDDLSVSLQREVELRSKIRAAFIYPLILLCLAFAITTFLVTFAIPKIAGVFLDSGFTPPLFSRIVFTIGLFANDHFIILLFALLVVVGPGVWFFWFNPVGRHMFDRGIRRVPVFAALYRDIAIQRFAATLSSLLKAGLPIIQAIEITSDVVGSQEFKSALLRISKEGLSKGLTVGEAFRREQIFPRVVTNLVAISEKAGHLSEVLDTLADFYVSSIDARIRTMVSFLEPVLLLFMGLLVGTIALSIIIPIYQLTTSF
jgi:type IV pilus assembly protein PilC